uniref:Expressed protein n=1 Tax=Echinococcus granulosus TaxID=6210 RepID=A0A068WFZ5_ECHGR|nr:expressed protein [Echinococcus granulosus]
MLCIFKLLIPEYTIEHKLYIAKLPSLIQRSPEIKEIQNWAKEQFHVETSMLNRFSVHLHTINTLDREAEMVGMENTGLITATG